MLCNARRGDGTHGSGTVHVVSGPPCSGKTTFVSRNRAEGDVVIDMDAIAQALGFGQAHGASGSYLRVALAARAGAIAEVLRKRCGAWIIHTQPSPEDVARYESCGAVLHVLDPGIDECLRRAEADARPDGTADAIRKWYGAPAAARLTETNKRKRDVALTQPFEDW